ncbi:hypothetical protein ABK040_004056 [Willaertia magna]
MLKNVLSLTTALPIKSNGLKRIGINTYRLLLNKKTYQRFYRCTPLGCNNKPSSYSDSVETITLDERTHLSRQEEEVNPEIIHSSPVALLSINEIYQSLDTELAELTSIIKRLEVKHQLENNDRILLINSLSKRIIIYLYQLNQLENAKSDLQNLFHLLTEDEYTTWDAFKILSTRLKIFELNQSIEKEKEKSNDQFSIISYYNQRSNLYEILGEYKSLLSDLNISISLLEKLKQQTINNTSSVQRDSFEKEITEEDKINIKLLNLYKQRMNLMLSFQTEIKRLVNVIKVMNDMKLTKKTTEFIHQYFYIDSLLNKETHPLQYLNNNIEILALLNDIFTNDDDKSVLIWNVNDPKLITKARYLELEVLKNSTKILMSDLKKAKPLVKENEYGYHLKGFEEAMEEEVKKLKIEKRNKIALIITLVTLAVSILVNYFNGTLIPKK